MEKAKPLTPKELNDFVVRLRATVNATGKLAELQRQLLKLKGTNGRKSGNGHAAKGAPKRRSRASANELRARILDHLSSTKGAALKTLASAVRATPEAVSYNLRRLRSEKKVRMSGARSTAQWHIKA
jgi:hypothetical protein